MVQTIPFFHGEENTSMRLLKQSSLSVVTKYSCLSLLIAIVNAQAPCQASGKIVATLRTSEGMKEHDSEEPRRLMHDVTYAYLNKGKIFTILNPVNLEQPHKTRPAEFAIGANLIAFSYSPEAPVRISISIQLVQRSKGKVVVSFDRAVSLSQSAVKSGLKLHKSEFDKSEYGRAISFLSLAAAKGFEERVEMLNPQ